MHEQLAQHSNNRCQEHIAAFLRYCTERSPYNQNFMSYAQSKLYALATNYSAISTASQL
ncbi:hypothetical protein L873DRAFT_1661551 [Choiromyces venosus 120613-1]|uniref:Uncharacterized protein n=1 Tax=Choiromyces venosus 120613-1 TaxID=1336337 RepID=A0A3N4K5J5_9PEZI|nr:hypothetical protein L873DRAFT_1661551 [Choiromyces venosus 120613-1]